MQCWIVKKDQFLREFLDPILTFKCPLGVAAKMTSSIWYCLVFLAFTAIFINEWRRRWNYTYVIIYTTSIMQLFFKRRRHGEVSYAALDVYSKQAECWVCFPCIRPTTAHSNHWTLKRSQLCPIAQEYSPHVIVITGNNFIPVLISALLRI